MTPPVVASVPFTVPVVLPPLLTMHRDTLTTSAGSRAPFGMDSTVSDDAPAAVPGRSNASTTVPVLGLMTSALAPMPRVAKPAQMSAMSDAVPPPALAAAMTESRPCSSVGFHGSSFMPSVTNCRMRSLPTAQPRRLMNRARTSNNAAAHTSPMLWTWNAVAEPPAPLA